MDDCGGVRTVHGGHAGPHCLLNLVLDRVVEQIPYSLVDVKPHGRTGIDSGRVTMFDGYPVTITIIHGSPLYIERTT